MGVGKPAQTLQKHTCAHVAVYEQTEKHAEGLEQGSASVAGGSVYRTEQDKGDGEGKSSPGN